MRRAAPIVTVGGMDAEAEIVILSCPVCGLPVEVGRDQLTDRVPEHCDRKMVVLLAG